MFAIVTGLTFTSCNETPKESEQNQEIKAVEAEIESTNVLVGSWVQPNPINDKQVQGFTIKNDGTAESINMTTMLYKKWWEEDGKLVLVSESVGNGSTSTDTLKYDIVKNTTTELEIKTGDIVDKYKKQ